VGIFSQIKSIFLQEYFRISRKIDAEWGKKTRQDDVLASLFKEGGRPQSDGGFKSLIFCLIINHGY